MTKKKSTVGILGAGITGLTIAYSLAQKGISVSVYEKRNEVGGAIHTTQKNGWLVEQGPNTLMVKSQQVWDLLSKLGLKEQLKEANSAAKKRFIVKDDTPVALPSSLGSFLSTPLFSAGAKLRLLKEPFVTAPNKEDDTIARFIERRLGKQPLEYGVNPFVSGIFAGDPKKLSVKHTFTPLWEMEQQHGSLLKGMFKRERPEEPPKKALVSFDKGNQALPKALAGALPDSVLTSTTVEAVLKEEKEWIVKGKVNNESFAQRHQVVISTLPAYTTPSIFQDNLFDQLADIPYAPLSVLALGFKKKQVNHPLDGFGMLVPEVENYKLLGCLFSSTLFSGRAPDGHHLITCFIGGARNPNLASKPKAELQSIVMEELDELLGVQGQPAFEYHKYWAHAIPQYELGYDRYLSVMNDIEQEQPGLVLDGNYRNGVSVPDCISSAIKTSNRVISLLKDHNKNG